MRQSHWLPRLTVPLALSSAFVLTVVVTAHPVLGILLIALFVGTSLLVHRHWAVLGFAGAAGMAEWLYAANTKGFLPVPALVGSVSMWAVVVALLAVMPSRSHEGLSSTGHPAITRATTFYAGTVAFSVVLALARQHDASVTPGMVSEVFIALAPISIMRLLASGRSDRFGLFTCVALSFWFALYGLMQFREHPSFSTGEGWLTLGATGRWWELSAVWGPFAATGKNAFGEALTFLAAILIPWAVHGAGSSIQRVAVRMSAVLLSACVLVTTSRQAGAVLLLIALLALAVPGTRRASHGSRILLVAAVALLVTVELVPSLIRGGENDDKQYTRYTVTRELLGSASPSWLLGTGRDTITTVTARLGIGSAVVHAGQSGPNPDNFYLRQLVESGVLGLTGFLYLLIVLFKEGIRGGVSPDQQVWRLSILGLASTLALESLISDTLSFEQLSGVFALCLGIAGAGLVRAQSREASDMDRRLANRTTPSGARAEPSLSPH